MLHSRPLLISLLTLGLVSPLAAPLAFAQDAVEAAPDPCAARGFMALEQAGREMVDAASRLDEPRYEASWREVQANIPCIPSVLTPRQAATIHLAYALGAFAENEAEKARWSYSAALEVLPYYEVPETIAPGAGHPLERILDEAKAADNGVPLAVDLPRGAALYLDGKPQAQRPSNRGAVAQVFTDDGKLLWAGYLYPNTNFPPPDMPAPPKSNQQKVARLSFVSAGALAAVALGAGVGAAGLSGRFVDSAEIVRLGPSPTPNDDLQTLEQRANRANALSITAQSSAALALGLTGFGVVVLW